MYCVFNIWPDTGKDGHTMSYYWNYSSPLGKMTLFSEDGRRLFGLWFDGQVYDRRLMPEQDKTEKENLLVFQKAAEWLDLYFSGKDPGIFPDLALTGSEFRRMVSEEMLKIPFGFTTTYGTIAKQIGARTGRPKVSAQAVGGAVGHNPLSVMVPCHRVVGKNGSLTGYAGGFEKKIRLLENEGIDLEQRGFFVPKVPSHGSAGAGKAAESRKTAEQVKSALRWPDGKPRCRWCKPDNERYIRYHDEEWGVPLHDDHRLFELLILEMFQAGLSWECVLNKREAFREAFDGFDLELVCSYGEEKLEELRGNPGIIRNRLKISAAVNNAKLFREIQAEYGSFDRYLWHWTQGKTLREIGRTTSPLSDAVSADLKRRGMKFVGTTIIYSYLQAAGVIYSHEDGCFLYRPPEDAE